MKYITLFLEGAEKVVLDSEAYRRQYKHKICEQLKLVFMDLYVSSASEFIVCFFRFLKPA